MKEFKIYWSPWCGYCAKVRGVASRLGLIDKLNWVNIAEDDKRNYIASKNGGKKTIPVVENTETGKWFFESEGIIKWLEEIKDRK